MTLITRLSDRVRALCRTMFGDNEVAQILDRAKAITHSEEAHIPGYFSTITTDEGDADIELGSTGSIASIVLDSASTTFGISFFVTNALAALNLNGTTGSVYIAATDNLAVALKIRIASGNSWLEFCSTNGAEAVMVTNNFGSTPPANQTIATSGTITLPTAGCTKVVDNVGDVTAIVMTPGLFDGQLIYLMNVGSGSVTFDAAATSNVADGASAVLATLRAMWLGWDSATARWVRTG